jgi:hypothetical protein
LVAEATALASHAAGANRTRPTRVPTTTPGDRPTGGGAALDLPGLLGERRFAPAAAGHGRRPELAVALLADHDALPRVTVIEPL